eukprot:scaffold264158_cov33-Prasinocladus_malaysianus.AAC.6
MACRGYDIIFCGDDIPVWVNRSTHRQRCVWHCLCPGWEGAGGGERLGLGIRRPKDNLVNPCIPSARWCV